MKVRTTVFVCACAIVLASIAYGFCHLWLVVRRIMPKESIVVCDLFDLDKRLLNYRESGGRWPDTLADLRTSEIELKDRLSCKPYVYFPHATPSSNDVLITQPEPFRMGLWPLGGMRRHALLANGEVRTFYGQEAIALGQTEDNELK